MGTLSLCPHKLPRPLYLCTICMMSLYNSVRIVCECGPFGHLRGRNCSFIPLHKCHLSLALRFISFRSRSNVRRRSLKLSEISYVTSLYIRTALFCHVA